MKIGIDLDGVVFDSEKLFRTYTELYEVQDLHKNTKQDNEEVTLQKRFRWNKQEEDGFWQKYHRYIIENSNFMPGVQDVLRYLKQEGHQFYVITARGMRSREMPDLTMQILKENDFEIFDGYFWATKNKEQICKQEEIDVMIDDSPDNCLRIAEAGTKVIYLKDAPSRYIEHENLITLYNWGEIYRYFHPLP